MSSQSGYCSNSYQVTIWYDWYVQPSLWLLSLVPLTPHKMQIYRDKIRQSTARSFFTVKAVYCSLTVIRSGRTHKTDLGIFPQVGPLITSTLPTTVNAKRCRQTNLPDKSVPAHHTSSAERHWLRFQEHVDLKLTVIFRCLHGLSGAPLLNQ